VFSSEFSKITSAANYKLLNHKLVEFLKPLMLWAAQL